MAKDFKGQGAYSADRGDASAFKPDTSFFDDATRAGEGESSSRPKYPDYAGGRSAKKPNVDPGLRYSGGNEGYEGD
jgi:hypothetical protein